MNEKLLKTIGEVVPEEAQKKLLAEWDPIIHVDRFAKPVYPDFKREVEYPELELVGPAELDLIKIEQWLHPQQVKGCVTGDEIHEELIDRKIIESCLGLADLQAIQVRGVGFFRKYFANKSVFGWKFIIRSCDEYFLVPYIGEGCGGIKLNWRFLANEFDSTSPALRVP